ncbi:hypothetical protein CORC01_12539 [Colletotrichum orchidophilum]|uniref:Aminotransferase class I/classII large domain-containing protein n=1 Tax=Colletotrichum orchidophilum TaxID=1209926 RepID=A0A1G4ASQ7_9PEZI|nr:uncharacterized protein CORC01_12539 [Colletotrichum orchidophilum]OHE92136.1 hypothetical protein CORC01_12539 [Colletotrichum orchidophilum]
MSHGLTTRGSIAAKSDDGMLLWKIIQDLLDPGTNTGGYTWFSPEMIVELMRLCQKYNMHLISDEIYALFVWNSTIDTQPAPANAAFFLWVDLGKAYREQYPGIEVRDISTGVMRALLDKNVFLASGKQFRSEQPRWFRIVFFNKKELLLEGLEGVAAALDV